jgi:hypothetical protein
MKYYDVAVEDADILSFDVYPIASKIAQVKGKLEYVARGVSNLVQRSMPGQTVWNAIETTALDPNTPVTPAQVRAEVWMSLVHGSRGIVYFVHEFAPKFLEDGSPSGWRAGGHKGLNQLITCPGSLQYHPRRLLPQW